MERTFSETLKALSGYFPTSLVSPSEFDKLLTIGKPYPSLISMGSAFETRLNDEDPSLDMFFAIDVVNKSIPAGTHPEFRLSNELFCNPVWNQIQQFFRAWCIPDSPLDQNVEQVFLEFDVGECVPVVPIPAVFIQINNTMYRDDKGNVIVGANEKQSPDAEWIFEALAIIKSGSISSGTLANARLCFERLLPDTRIDHAAIMASRQPDVMRLNITNLDEEKLYSYLEAIGLEGRIKQLQVTLPDFSASVDHFVLALDVSDTFSPRIGIELRHSGGELYLEDQSRWVSLLDTLVEQQMCCQQKRDGLAGWSGRSRELFDPELYRFMIYRYINLVKLVFNPDQPPTAKAYFSFMIRPFANA